MFSFLPCLTDGSIRKTLCLVGSVFGLLGCEAANDQAGNSDEQPGVRVVSQEVSYQPEETRVESVGTARARTTATIYPETGGEVIEVLFNAGEFVEKGDPLLRLEADDERLAVRLARVTVQEAEQLLERYRRIEDTGAISESQIDEGETALQAARIELEQAELNLARRTVIAPFSGYVGLTDIDQGARITSTTPIVELDDRQVLYIDFAVPEQVFRLLNEGDTISMSPFSDPDSSYDARIVGIDSRINSQDRSFTVRVEIDNDLDGLRPGMSFRVAFAIPGQEYPVVPEEAVVWGSDGAYVWAIEDGKVTQRTISILSREQGRVLVEANLAENDLIIVEGVQKVREGVAVDASEERPAPSSTSGAGSDAAAAGAGAP